MPESPRIKICGLREPDHVRQAVDLGVWAIGMVFADGSPRQIHADAAGELSTYAPTLERVGVFVDPDPDTLSAIADAAGLTQVQVHGDVDIAALREATTLPIIHGSGIRDRTDIERMDRSPADHVLLDAHVPGEHGGTGQRADWELLIAHRPQRPFLLAGGLDVSNVGDAIARVRPWGVDVSSGVEVRRGVKDSELIRAFVAAVRDADIGSAE